MKLREGSGGVIVHVQPVPETVLTVRPSGSVSLTVTVPRLEASPTFSTSIS